MQHENRGGVRSTIRSPTVESLSRRPPDSGKLPNSCELPNHANLLRQVSNIPEECSRREMRWEPLRRMAFHARGRPDGCGEKNHRVALSVREAVINSCHRRGPLIRSSNRWGRIVPGDKKMSTSSATDFFRDASTLMWDLQRGSPRRTISPARIRYNRYGELRAPCAGQSSRRSLQRHRAPKVTLKD